MVSNNLFLILNDKLEEILVNSWTLMNVHTAETKINMVNQKQ